MNQKFNSAKVFNYFQIQNQNQNQNQIQNWKLNWKSKIY